MPSACALEVLGGEIPVQQFVDHSVEKIWPPVLIIEIISVFPDIDGKKTFLAFSHRSDRVRGLLNLELTIVRYQPNPAAAEFARHLA